ncbi:MAG: hypothetical protein AAF738_03960 [Bacteroidota bacterium]
MIALTISAATPNVSTVAFEDETIYEPVFFARNIEVLLPYTEVILRPKQIRALKKYAQIRGIKVDFFTDDSLKSVRCNRKKAFDFFTHYTKVAKQIDFELGDLCKITLADELKPHAVVAQSKINKINKT